MKLYGLLPADVFCRLRPAAGGDVKAHGRTVQRKCHLFGSVKSARNVMGSAGSALCEGAALQRRPGGPARGRGSRALGLSRSRMARAWWAVRTVEAAQPVRTTTATHL
jgi:hypothetical protein